MYYNYDTSRPDMYYIEQDDKRKDLAAEEGYQCPQEERVDYNIANQKMREANEKTYNATNIDGPVNNDLELKFQSGHGHLIPQITSENSTIYAMRNETL